MSFACGRRCFARVSRFGRICPRTKTGYSHAPVVEKARGLLGSRANPKLPGYRTSRHRLPGSIDAIPFQHPQVVTASSLWIAFTQGVSATSVEPAKDLRVDPALCLAAASRVTTTRRSRLRRADRQRKDRKGRPYQALIARGAAYERKDMIDRTIADMTACCARSSLADIHNARGELWRKKGDLPKAVADFAAAIKLNPDHVAARANHRSMALELERLGALKAVAGKPSFNCATARRKVEKAICANPELADLDREVEGSYIRAAAEKMTPQQARKLRREQAEYISRRNAEYGRSGYDLKKAMRDRLKQINGIDGY